MAKIHKHSENFNCDHDRFKIDLFHLIEEPLSNIKPYLKGRDSDWKFLNSFASSLLKNIENTQAETLDFGLCHGDLHYQNVHKLNEHLI